MPTANISPIVSKGFTEGYYYRPRVDMEVLNRYHEGLIALSACLAGEVQRNIVKNLPEEAPGGPVEVDDAVHDAVIRDGGAVHAQLFYTGDVFFDFIGAVQEGVFRVDVKAIALCK